MVYELKKEADDIVGDLKILLILRTFELRGINHILRYQLTTTTRTTTANVNDIILIHMNTVWNSTVIQTICFVFNWRNKLCAYNYTLCGQESFSRLSS